MKKPRSIYFVAILLSCLTACGDMGGSGISPNECAAMEQVRQSFHASNDAQWEQLDDLADMVKSGIEASMSNGNFKSAYLLREIDQLQSESKTLRGHILELEKKLIDIGGGAGMGTLAKPEENKLNQQLWGLSDANGGRGDGEARMLARKLNEYVAFANELMQRSDSNSTRPHRFQKIAIDPADDPSVPSYVNKEHPWEVATFGGTSVIADLVTLERLHQAVLQIQDEVLSYFVAMGGDRPQVKIDSLVLLDAPVSRRVAAGMKFETLLAVAMMASDVKPEFLGGGVLVNPGGTSATLSMTAPGGFAVGQREKEAAYSATVKVPIADGSIYELQLQGKYTVFKPEAVFTSASMQLLYAHCGNTVSFDVPALGEFYAPKFTASDAQVLPSTSDKRVVTIVPSGKTCILGLSSLTNGQSIKIEDWKFRVVAPPVPKIRLMVDGKEYDGLNAFGSKSEVLVQIVPDNDFRNGLPKDARYTIDQIDVLLQKTSVGSLTKVGSVDGGGKDATKGISFSLANMLKDANPGSKGFIKIRNIDRINFQNKQIAVNFDDREKVIGFVVK